MNGLFYDDKILFSNKQGLAKYNSQWELVYGKFYGLPKLVLSIEIFDSIISATEGARVRGGFYDLMEVKGTFTHLNSYFKSRFIPAMLPRGYKYVAVITSADPFTKFALNTILLITMTQGIETKIFNDLESAKSWLERMLCE